MRKIYLLDLSNFTTSVYNVLIESNQVFETKKIIKL